MRKEKLDQDNRWRCSGCQKSVRPTKHLSIFRPPLTLCIHLKRFEFTPGGSAGGLGWNFKHRYHEGGGAKISKRIAFPALLRLPLSDGRVCQYLLTGVIVHVGSRATSGHYTAFVKRPGSSNQWYHMDDCHTQTVSEKTVLKQRDAYVLFYTRKEVKQEFPSSFNSAAESADVGAGCSPLTPRPTSDQVSCHDSGKDGPGPSKTTSASAQATIRTKGDHTGGERPFKQTAKDKGRGPRKNREKWRPPDAVKLGDAALLLGGISVGNWDGDDIAPRHDPRRLSATRAMEDGARARKKKMRPGFWDSQLDAPKRPKVKKHRESY